MIARRTVFVLGAGASLDYNFPSGPGLVRSILAGLGDPVSDFFEYVREAAAVRTIALTEFRTALLESRRTSIDRFLQTRQDYLTIGKAAIAASLIPLEIEANLYKPAEFDWYQYLFDHIIGGASPEFFKRNRLTIVTFNFERSFEFALFKALQASYGLAAEQAAELASSIPVHHIHGDIGESAWLPRTGGWCRPYSPAMTTTDVVQAAKRIKLVHEEVEGPTLKAAVGAMANAERVCFLGFGYHAMNMRRLCLPQDVRLESYATKPMYGTRLGMTDGEWMPVAQATKSLNFNNYNQSVIQFLRAQPFVHEESDT